jgi:hypothetical protein
MFEEMRLWECTLKLEVVVCCDYRVDDSGLKRVVPVLCCAAAVAWEPKGEFVVQDVQVDPPQAMEVRIKVTHSSLCRSDVFFWENEVGVCCPHSHITLRIFVLERCLMRLFSEDHPQCQ